MKEKKHTPGPWHIQHRTIVGPGGENWGPIATVAGNARLDNEANARLIAAAPEMFDVLIALDSFIRTAEKLSPDSPVTKDLLEWHDQLLELIKRAGGSN